MESQPQNPEIWNSPENFHPRKHTVSKFKFYKDRHKIVIQTRHTLYPRPKRNGNHTPLYFQEGLGTRA